MRANDKHQDKADAQELRDTRCARILSLLAAPNQGGRSRGFWRAYGFRSDPRGRGVKVVPFRCWPCAQRKIYKEATNENSHRVTYCSGSLWNDIRR